MEEEGNLGSLYSTDQQNYGYNENFVWLSRDEAGSLLEKAFFFSQPPTVFGSKKRKEGEQKFAQTYTNLLKLTQSIYFGKYACLFRHYQFLIIYIVGWLFSILN